MLDNRKTSLRAGGKYIMCVYIMCRHRRSVTIEYEDMIITFEQLQY